MNETRASTLSMRPFSIALIGCGSIGRTVLKELPRQFGDRVRVAAVLVRRLDILADAPELSARSALVTSPEEMLQRAPDLVIECASHQAVRQYGCAVLAAGRDLMIVSTGVLADERLHQELTQTAAKSDARLHLVAGAVGAVDVLDAMRRSGLSSVHYSGTKPPAAWRGSAAEQAIDLSRVTEATRFFHGTAREAAAMYPKNANVAATVAIAGIGFDRTEVSLLADPGCAANQHVFEATGACGSIRFAIQAAPSGNVRSSAIVGHSVCHAIGSLVDLVVFA